MKGSVKGSDQDVTYRDHIQNTNGFRNNSFNMGVKYMKTGELVAWNFKSFTYEFLGFRPPEHRDMKLQSNTSYMVVTTSLNS